jgi:flagellar hook-associated protein 3 FlgL
MLTRVGDTAQSDRVLAAIQATTARVRAAQIEVSTGKRAGGYEEISGEAGLLLRSKEQRALAEGYARQNDQVVDRLTAMDGALANLGAIAQRMKALLVQRLDAGSGALVPLDREAGTMLAEVAAQLNLKLDERYLFAGSRIGAPPVGLPDPPATTADPGLYYRGDGVIPTARADRDVEVAYGLTADDPAFAALIGALGQASAAHLAGDRAGLETALSGLDRAVEGIAELRGQVGATSARLESIADAQRGAVLYLDDIVSRIEDADVPEALTRIARDQASLEAAYLTTSRIGQLSLADYLR